MTDPTPQLQPRLRLWIDGVELEMAGERVLELEVEERSEGASSFVMRFDMGVFDTEDGQADWSLLERGPFQEGMGGPLLQLMSRITIAFLVVPDPGTGQAEAATVFDGYVTEMAPSFGPLRTGDSRLEVRGLDASCLMHFQTVTRTWSDMSDADIAAAIFAKFGFAADIEATSPDRAEDRASIVQRCTDAEFLQHLARRNGYETYVEAGQGEVEQAEHQTGLSTGHFHRARPDDPEVQHGLNLFPGDTPSLKVFEATWDSHGPTRIRAWRLDELSRQVQRDEQTDPGYARLGTTSRADQIGARLRAISFPSGAREAAEGEAGGEAPGDNVLEASEIATGWTPHHASELATQTVARFREADWFLHGKGIVRGERYPGILRARRPVAITGAGSLLSGTWYIKSLCHRWARDPEAADDDTASVDRLYEIDLDLVRHGLGPDAGAATAPQAAGAGG